MYSTELIRKFPDNPTRPILYVVYNHDHIRDAETFVGMIHGEEYLKNVTIVPFNSQDETVEKHRLKDYEVYIDPLVYTYKHSWNN